MSPWVLGPLLAAGLGVPQPLPARALTTGERHLLASIFRDAIDYDAIRIVRGHAFALQDDATYVTLGDRIYVPAPLYHADYARMTATAQAVLVHEVTHVWQRASGMHVAAQAIAAFIRHGGRYDRTYPYRLSPGRDLLDYGIEQQASILADYFLARGADVRRYREVLRRFLADPKYARAAERAAGR
jgi:hypothetical protein